MDPAPNKSTRNAPMNTPATSSSVNTDDSRYTTPRSEPGTAPHIYSGIGTQVYRCVDRCTYVVLNVRYVAQRFLVCHLPKQAPPPPQPTPIEPRLECRRLVAGAGTETGATHSGSPLPYTTAALPSRQMPASTADALRRQLRLWLPCTSASTTAVYIHTCGMCHVPWVRA